jgi:ABC-type nitrate/sulfonate/bicarbonate transport system ATPase subunit
VLVLSERPARIRDEVVLKVPRPRDPTDPEVVSAVRRILGVLGLKPATSEPATSGTGL